MQKYAVISSDDTFILFNFKYNFLNVFKNGLSVTSLILLLALEPGVGVGDLVGHVVVDLSAVSLVTHHQDLKLF